MRVDVAFTPAEAVPADVGVVVDVMRATSTIAQALASGYRRVLCCGEIDEARALRDELGEGLLAGERDARRIEGFDLGASPSEFVEPKARTLVMSTTNGTRAIVAAAASCRHVLLGSLLNLSAVVEAAKALGEDVVVFCSGFQGRFAVDDAYCAGRIVALLGAERSDAAVASEVIARAFPEARAGIEARTYGPPGLEDDIAWVSQVDRLDVVPRFTRTVGPSAEVTASGHP